MRPKEDEYGVPYSESDYLGLAAAYDDAAADSERRADLAGDAGYPANPSEKQQMLKLAASQRKRARFWRGSIEASTTE